MMSIVSNTMHAANAASAQAGAFQTFPIPYDDAEHDWGAFAMSDDEGFGAVGNQTHGEGSIAVTKKVPPLSESGKKLEKSNIGTDPNGATESVKLVNVPFRVVPSFPKGIHRVFRDKNSFNKQVGIKLPAVASEWVVVELHLLDKTREHKDYVPDAPKPFAEAHVSKHLHFCWTNNIAVEENKGKVFVETGSLPNGVLEFHQKTFPLGRKKKSMVYTKEPKFVLTVTPVDTQGKPVNGATVYKTKAFQVRSKEQPNKDLAAAGKPSRSKKRRRTALSEKKRQMLESLENDIKNFQKDINEETASRASKQQRMHHMLALLKTVPSPTSSKMFQMITSLLQAHEARGRNIVGV